MHEHAIRLKAEIMVDHFHDQVLAMKKIGIGMFMTGRLDPFGLIQGGGCKGSGDIDKMLKKAFEIEDRRKGYNS